MSGKDDFDSESDLSDDVMEYLEDTKSDNGHGNYINSKPIKPMENVVAKEEESDDEDATDDDDEIMDYLNDGEVSEEKNYDTKENIILGIDLGTTNSCISIWRNNNVEIIPDEYGNKTIPSYVSYSHVSKYVGIDAKKQKDINTENVFYEVKRIIGRNFNDTFVQECSKLLSYKIIENERNGVSLQSTVRGNKVFTPEEISSSVLMKLKNNAIKYLKCDVKDVVITVPAHFSDSQRQATKDAAIIAGLNCVRMINEPTAAALAYGIMDRSIKRALNNADDDYTILVYDFGGGTLDVSLMNVCDGVFEVLGSSGISYFGGVDFDNRLMTYCITKFCRQFYRNDELDTSKISPLSLQKLRLQCESAKKILSTNVSAHVGVENFYDNHNLVVKINRGDFENLCRDLFLLCLKSIDDIMIACDISDNDIDEVILVGGMTKMPYIREMLVNRFQGSAKSSQKNKTSKINCSINPDEAVSVGAAIQGYIIANQNNAFSDSVTLLDVTPLSLGVETVGGIMDILIERNTQIPYEVTKLYTTDTDHVDSVLIKVFEGERSMTKHNFKVGEFLLENIPRYPRGMPEIEVSFNIDNNGLVTVSAFEKEANQKKSISVNTNKNGLKPEQIRNLVEEAYEQETLDELDRVKKINYYEIEDLCSNVLTNISNKEFKLTKKDIDVITQDMQTITDFLKEKKYDQREIDEYEDVLENLKKKYGVLILHGRIEDNKVKAKSTEINATCVYGNEDDEDEQDLKEAFQRIKRNEIGNEGMTDNEISELKDMRSNLYELCNNIMGIISSGRMNLSREHQKEFNEYMNDVLLWYSSHEKPTKKDYKEKIDYVNSICDEIIEKFEKENKSLIIQSNIVSDHDKDSDRLEKLCLTLMTMISNGHIPGSQARLIVLNKKLEESLKYMFDFKDAKNISISEGEFQKKCSEYSNEINELCDNIHNNMQGIFVSENRRDIVMSKVKKVVDEDHLKSYVSNGDNEEGTSILELLQRKQNEEIDQSINNQLDDNNDDSEDED